MNATASSNSPSANGMCAARPHATRPQPPAPPRAGEPRQGRGGVDARNAVSEPRQLATGAALPAAEVERRPASVGKDTHERRPVETLEELVMPRRASPGHPFRGFRLPGVAQARSIHEAIIGEQELRRFAANQRFGMNSGTSSSSSEPRPRLGAVGALRAARTSPLAGSLKRLALLRRPSSPYPVATTVTHT